MDLFRRQDVAAIDALVESDDDEEIFGDSEDENPKEEDDKSASGEDYTDDEDEGEDGYRPGGYHPVQVGEVYNQR